MATDYEQLAPGYDQRYRDRSYPGVKQALLDQFGDAKGAVLEVGCGTAQWVAALRESGVCAFGLDLSTAMLREARRRADGSVLRGTAARLPLRDGSCEGVLSVHAAHHFPDKLGFVREAARVLTPRGKLVVISLDPHRGDDRWVVYQCWPQTRERDMARYASTEQWRALAHDAGLALRQYAVAEHLQEVRAAEDLLARPDALKLSTSQLADLSADEYEAGLERLRQAARAADTPLLAHADLKLCMWVFAHAQPMDQPHTPKRLPLS